METDWLIIGGGIHGVHVAARLIGEAGVARDRVGIVDPGEGLLSRWRACTSTTGMSYLRSPGVHHLDLAPGSLHQFAGRRKRRKPGLFSAPYARPSLQLFNAHCDRVVESFALDDCHIRDRAESCSVDCDGVAVALASGREVSTQNLILAIGASETPEWPDWARRGDGRVHHVFDKAFDGWPTSPQTVAVVGGGISAGHVALRLIEEGHEVHLVSRHALRQHQFDSDPGWLGPKFMTGFSRERDLDRRREMIADARHKGSVPPEILHALHRAIDAGRLRWHECGIEGSEAGRDALLLRLASGTELTVDTVLLATGFSARRPGGAMVDSLIASASLPCASCGYPVVDEALRWHPRIYVTGPLAELELGPVSRNIAGARRAGDRLVDFVRANGPATAG